MYAAKSPLELRLPAGFSTGSGWQADAPYYCGTFDPVKGWKNKSKGELMLRFDDMPKCVKVTLRSLLDFNPRTSRFHLVSSVVCRSLPRHNQTPLYRRLL